VAVMVFILDVLVVVCVGGIYGGSCG